MGSMADPVCPRLSEMAAKAIGQCKGKLATGATYLAMEGPQFSTRAESHMYRAWGADVIGMTAMPEAKLARDMVLQFIKNLPKTRKASPIDTALDDAVITAPEEHDPALLAKLDAVAGRILTKK